MPWWNGRRYLPVGSPLTYMDAAGNAAPPDAIRKFIYGAMGKVGIKRAGRRRKAQTEGGRRRIVYNELIAAGASKDEAIRQIAIAEDPSFGGREDDCQDERKLDAIRRSLSADRSRL
jgi:hypothetical protein